MPKAANYFHALSDDPAVYVIVSGWGLNEGMALAATRANGRPAKVLVFPYWHLAAQVLELAEKLPHAERLFPNLEFTLLCPTEVDVAAAVALGLRALCIHQNAFIDHRLFRPISIVHKTYTAVHNANLQDWKRHHLAYGVKNIAVITYGVANEDPNKVLGGYVSAHFANFRANGQFEFLTPRDINVIYNLARCGLILSAVEGANFASAEYMFAGIPVVSTPSLGGRDAFFCPEDVLVVPAKPEAVMDAVTHWQDNAPPAEAVRERALARARPHRAKLLDWLADEAGLDLRDQADADGWVPAFRDKLREWVTADVIVEPAAFKV